MTDLKDRSSLFLDFASGFVWVFLLGALYGCVEAAGSLDAMHTTVSPSAFVNVPYRLFLGAVFFVQFFIFAWCCFFVLTQFLSLLFTKLKNVTSVAWAISCSICTATVLPLWVSLNAWLPAFRSFESIAGNLIFALATVCFVILLAIVLGKRLSIQIRNVFNKFVPLVLVELIFIVLLFSASNEPPLKKPAGPLPATPNILLITVDTLRADHLSSYGYTKIQTPNIDRIGQAGVLYERMLSPTSWTLPTFATIMTGVDPFVHGMTRHDVALDSSFETIAQSLGKGGYSTYAVVTNEFLNHPYKLDRGFDRYQFSRDPEAYDPFAGLFLYDFLFAKKLERHSAQNMTTRAIRMLRQCTDRRFFLWVHYIDPHTPYGAWYIDRYPDYDKDYDGRLGNEFDDFDRSASVDFFLSAKDKRHIQALYDAEIMYTDKHIGRLLDAVDQLGLDQNTVVIFTSDHGEEFWDHGDVLHGRSLYVESVHVPFMIRWPGKIQAKTREKRLASLIDLPATIADIAGRPLLPFSKGRSRLGEIEDPWAESIYVSLDKINPNGKQYFSRGIYQDERTYLYKQSPIENQALFDTLADPEQRLNLFLQDPALDDKYIGLLSAHEKTNEILKSMVEFKDLKERIELTPDMKDALKGLGYIN